MKKRFDLIFAASLVPIDYLALLFTGWAVYSLRFESITGILPVVSAVPFDNYLKIVLLVAVAWVAVLAMTGVYRLRQQLTSELGRIFVGVSTSVLLVIVFIFFRREFFASRFIIVASWVLAIVVLWLFHALVRGFQHYLYRQGIGVRQIVLFGNDPTTNELVRLFKTRPALGYRLMQIWPEINLDNIAAFEEMIKQGTVDEVILGDPNIPKAQTLQILDRCTEHNISFKYAADVFDTQAGNIDIHDLAGVPIIEIKRTPLDGWGRIFKRGVDIILGAIFFLIMLIPGIIVAIMIKLDSAGPVFVRLERVGQGQRRFRLWKFRSMIKDAHVLKPQLLEQNERSDGPLFKMTHDPRITRVGRFIRKTSLDEFPQLINVLKGEMSLIGPRPHEPEEVARYEKHHKKLLTIKPGMTGMAQISGRSNLSFEEEYRLDIYYIENWSLELDIQILLRTPLAILRVNTAA